jgi:hypothetical protein
MLTWARTLTTAGVVASSLFGCAALAAAQGDVTPAAPTAPATQRNATIGIQGIAIVGVTWPSASKTFEATKLPTKPIEVGGGVQVSNIWRDLFAQVSASRFSETGERAFVDDQGNAFQLGIPLKVKATYLDVSAGWKIANDASSNVVTYFGGGVGRVSYQESSPFAQPGDDVDTSTTSYHVLVGAEVKVLSWLSVSGDMRYRWVPNLLGDGGVSAAYGEKDFGGFQLGAGVRVGVGGRRLRKAPPSDDDKTTEQPREPRDPYRFPTRTQTSDAGTIVGSAPVYLRPDPKLDPLRVLQAGTSVKVLQENGEWIRIQFEDRVLGSRVGYVLRKDIQLPK